MKQKFIFKFAFAIAILSQTQAWVLSLPANATPAQVILIRHGEKPDEGNELNARGWKRANALPKLFMGTTPFTQFGLPIAIYAMSPKDEDGSVRPIQTVTPLANQLRLEIHHTFLKKELNQLVNEIRSNPAYEGHTVLICWEHKMIPLIAGKFGAKDAPDSWKGSVYDRAWLLTFKNNRVVGFEDLPQHLLSGDTPH